MLKNMTLARPRRAAILLSLVIFIVGSSTGVSYALWSTNASISGSGSAGTVGITASGVGSTPLTALTNAGTGPGSTATTSVSVRNTGTVAMTYTTTIANTESPTTSAFGDNIGYTIWVTTAASNCTSTATVGTPSWTGTLNSGTGTLGANRPLAVGGTEIYCVRTLLSATAPQSIQGQGVSSVLTFLGANS
jgi:hypothetical protein